MIRKCGRSVIVSSRDRDDSTWWATQPGEGEGVEKAFYIGVALKLFKI